MKDMPAEAKIMPMMHMSEEDCPEICDMNPGDEKEMTVKMKMVGKNMSKMDGKDHVTGDFEVESVRPIKKEAGKYNKAEVKKAIASIR